MGQVYGGEADGATRPSVALEIQLSAMELERITPSRGGRLIPWMGWGRGKGKKRESLLIYHHERTS